MKLKYSNKYYVQHDLPGYENPSPGNNEGGISTLEDKSLGYTQKGRTATVMDALKYAEPIKVKGLNLSLKFHQEKN